MENQREKHDQKREYVRNRVRVMGDGFLPSAAATKDRKIVPKMQARPEAEWGKRYDRSDAIS